MHTPTPSTTAPPDSRYLILIGIVAATAGFLFGYDTAVVSGAIGFLQKRFALSAELTGWAASSMLIGCMAGAALGGPLGDRLGRKPSLILCAVLFAVSSAASALPQTIAQFAWARFTGGVAIGVASIVSPIYLAEVAPERLRGRMVALYQLAIVIGIVIVYFVNLQIQRQGDEAWNVAVGWRWMFASLIGPSVLFAVCMSLVPESPRWLLKAGRRDEARTVMERVGGVEAARRDLVNIEAALHVAPARWSELLRPGYRRALLIGVALAVFQQFSGINAIMYFAPEIFRAAGAGIDSAFRQTVLVGVVNLLFTFGAIWLVDRAGRKPLLIVGTAVQTLALALVSLRFGQTGTGGMLLTGILVFVAAFAMAMGPVTWIVNAEIFPTKLRGRAMSISILCLWFADWIVTQTFPALRETVGPAVTFGLYAICSVASLCFVWFLVPETKGRTLEEIEASWRRAT